MPSPYRAHSQLPAPEAITIGVPYTFNYNPDDSHQYFNCADRLDKAKSYMTIWLAKLKPHIRIHLELSKMGRLHWHGTIKFQNNAQVLEFFLFKIIQLTGNGHIEIDTISDMEEWSKYITKSKHILDVCLDSHKLKTPLKYANKEIYRSFDEYLLITKPKSELDSNIDSDSEGKEPSSSASPL